MNSHPICISPSILSANLATLAKDVEATIQAGAKMIHIDIMDNHYVPNLTFGPIIIKALKTHGIQVPLDVHIMASPTERLVEMSIEAGADRISIHPDACIHLDRQLSFIAENGVKVGVALNPSTHPSILEYCPHLDFILIMLVNPGFGGQRLQAHQIDKIKTVRKMYPDISIQVDGGVTAENIKQLYDAGADNFVAGSAVFSTTSIPQSMNALIRALGKF